MSANLTSIAYLVAAVLFILALRGLSSPVTSRQGNRFGMIGMGVAVVATLARSIDSCRAAAVTTGSSYSTRSALCPVLLR